MKKKKIEVTTNAGSFDLNTNFGRPILEGILKTNLASTLGLDVDKVIGLIHCYFSYDDVRPEQIAVDIPFFLSKFGDIVSPLFLRPQQVISLVGCIPAIEKTLDVPSKQDNLIQNVAGLLSNFVTGEKKVGNVSSGINGETSVKTKKNNRFNPLMIMSAVPTLQKMKGSLTVDMILTVDSVEIINAEAIPATMTMDSVLDQQLEIHARTYHASRTIVDSSLMTRPSAMNLLSSPAVVEIMNGFSFGDGGDKEKNYQRDFSSTNARRENDLLGDDMFDEPWR